MLQSSLKAGLLGLLAIPSTLAQSYTNTTPSALLSNVTVFSPPSNYTVPRTLYARTLLLNQNCETDNHILGTFTIRPPGITYLPIFESDDGGNT